MHADQKYIDALLNNDFAVQEELYKKFSDKIKWMVVHNNGAESDAGDVLQDGLLSIYKQAKKGNLILTCPFEAFLFTICKYKWLKELAKRKHGTAKNATNEHVADEVNIAMIEEIELSKARNILLNDKLQQLSTHCRQLLELSWSGKSMHEVAQIMHVSYSYVRKKKSCCMTKLILSVKQASTYNALKW